MKIRTIKIKNFRSYKNEVEIEFGDLSAFVGKNDIGKSTVLEALDIFFNNGKGVIKLDKDDVNKQALAEGDTETVISVCFEELPASIVIDSTNQTTLQDEYLLNSNNWLEIVKKYSNGGKEKVFVKTNHPTGNNCKDLLLKKNTELQKILRDNTITCSNQTINALMRTAIWQHYNSDLQLEDIEIDVTKGDTKSIWDKLQTYLPLYSLFVPDPKEEVLVANKEGEGEQTTSSEDAAEQFAKNPGANPIAEKAPEKIPEPKEVVENVVEEVIETPKEEVIEIATDMNEAVVETAEKMTEEAIPEKEDPVKQEVILANEVPKTAEVEKKEVPQPEVEVAVVEEEKKEEVATPAPPKGNNKGIVFKVQLMASTKEIALQSSNFGGLNKLSEERFNQFHRYMYGSTDSYTQAKLLKSNADAKGYPTSYIVAYRDGVRIPTPDAIKLVSE